ncbi:MAG: hypothetical protein KM310_09045 [Clostridiales bacterium]|nr:hypothetical protein [Clostridiales bacterium]
MRVQGLARWTMAYVAAAYVSFLLGQAVLLTGKTFPMAGLSSPWTLAAVHLFTIGWLTLLMLGALGQFLPVITASAPRGHGFYLAGLFLMAGGLLAMEIGFLTLERGTLWLPLGGSAVLLGVLLDLAALLPLLFHARPLPFAARFVAAALGGLLVTLAMGISLALGLTRPEIYAHATLGQLFTAGLVAHLAAGVGAWFTLTAMGVSYKLLAMFSLAPEDRGALGKAVLGLTAGGFGLALLGSLLPLLTGWRVPWLTWGGWAAAGLGGLFYLVDMVLLFRQRKRRNLELNSVFAGWALMAFGVSGVALLAASLDPGLVPAALYLYLLGWLSGLGLSQLYKIVPFLTWVERYGRQLGRGPVPRVQDLVDEGRARPWFVLYFVAVFLAAIFLTAGAGAGFLLGQAVALLASAMIGREIWRSRYGAPAVEHGERRVMVHG